MLVIMCRMVAIIRIIKIMQFWSLYLTLWCHCYIRHFIALKGKIGSLRINFPWIFLPHLSLYMQKEWENTLRLETFWLFGKIVTLVHICIRYEFKIVRWYERGERGEGVSKVQKSWTTVTIDFFHLWGLLIKKSALWPAWYFMPCTPYGHVHYSTL